MANIAAIVGRPNVGKSTFFNRLVEAREAIIDNVSGVTRDRHYGSSEWIGKQFTVIDTGGYVHGSDDIFEEAIRTQAEVAMEEASVILFVVDCQEGLHPLDKEFAKVIRHSKKPIFIIANKADNYTDSQGHFEFYELGLEANVYPISAMSGSGTGELLDEVAKEFHDIEEDESEIPRIAIVGRPNAGKSSLTNALLNKERSIVTDIAGTTRDSIDAHYKAYGKEFILTDTAGIRRKSRVKEDIEFYSVLRAVTAIEKSDVCIAVVDAERGLESQDVNIINMAIAKKKGVVIMINKWDLIEKDSNTAAEYKKAIIEEYANFSYLPIIFTSVTEKQRIFQVIDKAIEVCEARRTKISTSKLNNLILPEIERYPPPSHRGHYINIKYITQLPVYTPTFAFFCNHPKHIKAPYVRFLESKLRGYFPLEGVPIKILFKSK